VKGVDDMDNDVKEMLRRRAEDVRIDPSVPAPLLRRSRRRRASSAVLGAITAMVVVAGAVVGSQALIHTSPGPAETPTPDPTATGFGPPVVSDGAFAGIWPERNADELQAAQTAFDQGTDEYRLDPSGTAVEFAHQVFGWDPSIIDAGLEVPPGESARPIDVVNLHFGTLTREEGLEPHAPYALHVSVQQLGETGDAGIWSVVGISSDLIDETCDISGPVTAGESIHVCGTTSWDPLLGSMRAWVAPGEEATNGLDPDEASPSANPPIGSDGSFDASLGPIPAAYGTSGMVVIERLDQAGLVVGASARKVAIRQSEPSPQPTTAPLEPQDLPEAVAKTRQELYTAAVNHDWDAVQRLITIPEFSFTFAGVDEGRPVADQAIEYWQRQSDFHGLDQLDIMALLLNMDPATETAEGTTFYEWPFALTMTPDELRNMTEEQKAQLRELYPNLDHDLEDWAGPLGGYYGWRLGIREDGAWVFFIAGD